ncbi:MAG: peptidoglycan D,D-transpeptidase FtsI family protein [Armatimonadota bacterium]|jgi:stage V sporulation protein D (sporulation-specific penicillin-binding protein)
MAHGRAYDARAATLTHPLVRGRVRLFLAGIALLMVILAGKLLSVQVFNRSHYLELDARIHRGPDPETPVPGGIYSRELQPMAVSVPRLTIYANPVQIAGSERGIDGTARQIADLAGLDAEKIRAALEAGAERGLKSITVARLLDPEQVVPLAESRPAGVWTEREWRRVYPGERLACHVLGRRSSWHEPLEGAELRWAFLLDGRPGTPSKNMDSYGRSILGADSTGVLRPDPGKNLVLTLDWSLQQVVELALDKLMEQNQPKAATCTVMDPRTGEILALASRPNFNPGAMAEGSPEEITTRLKNLPVVRQYEPGSLFKVLLAAATLESEQYRGTEAYYCGGYTPDLGGQPLRCWDPKGHGTADLAKMLSHSCNIAAARFALLIGGEYYHAFLKGLGLGERMGIGLPGEASGALRGPQGMRVRDLANLGFGQGVSVTDIQMLSAVSAVVNGGTLMQPHIVRAVMDAETNRVVREIEPLPLRQVCSQETSARVREMMGAVVERGTGRRAAIEGMAVGGKTGTAQKWLAEEGGFVRGRNIVSFVMVAPLDDPRFAILVTADEPAIGEHGSEVAAPVAKTVALAALREAGMLPEEVEISEEPTL